MFTNRVQQYALQPSCLYQPGYGSNYHESEIAPIGQMDSNLEATNPQPHTWTNFSNPTNRIPSGYDQLVIMNHNTYSYSNQILDYNGQFQKSSPDLEYANQPERLPADMRGFAAFKSDGRRSSESAVAVSSDGLSGSESPEMGAQYTLNNRAAVTKAPQMLRADFEWMTKTSYQSQPNPGECSTSVLFSLPPSYTLLLIGIQVKLSPKIDLETSQN